MNVVVSSKDLLKELELLGKVVAQKSTIPSLANFLVQAEGNGLKLAATDLEIGLITFCPALVNVPGTITLPVKHLLEIVRLLPERDVELVLENGAMKLTSGRYSSRIQTVRAEDYPTLPSMKDLPQVTLPASITTLIRRVRFACIEKSRTQKFYMDGALLTSHSLAATDGHRLAYTTCADFGLAENVIIPSKALDKLAEMVAGETTFAVGPRHLFFVTDGRLLFSRMISEPFPNYERIIPRDTNLTAVIPRLQLQDSLRRVTLTANEVVFKFTANLLTVTTRSAAIGDAVEPIDINYDGPETTLTLNGSYVLDFINAGEGSHSTWAWRERCPLMMTDSDSYCYVQLPLVNA